MSPFVDANPREVPLPRAPLVRVLCQLRFPAVLSIEQQSFVAPFQEALRQHYPVLRPEQTTGFVLGPTGMMSSKPEIAWRFSDLANDWRVSLASTFLAVETTKYSSRSEFLQRLAAVVAAAKEHVKPAVVDRIGIRYLDRLSGEALQQLPSFIRPEILGVLHGDLQADVSQSVTETMLNAGSAQMLARWGQIPAKATMDPNFMEPLDAASWILDLDIFSRQGDTTPFVAGDVVDVARGYSERIHAFFRWCVTDEFLRFYGGDV